MLKERDIDPQKAPIPMRLFLAAEDAESVGVSSESEPNIGELRCEFEVFVPSSHSFSTIPVRTKAHNEHVDRSRFKHHPEVHSGYIVVRVGVVVCCDVSGSGTGRPDDVVVSSLNMYTCVGGEVSAEEPDEAAKWLFSPGTVVIDCTRDALRNEVPQEALLKLPPRVGDDG